MFSSKCPRCSAVFWQPDKLREWHEQLMDFQILHPRATREEMARVFNCTPATITNITQTDIYQARLMERRRGRQDNVDKTVVERLEGLTHSALDTIEHKLEHQRELLGLTEVRETAEMALKALGYIAPQSGRNVPQVQQTVVVVDAQALEDARLLMRQRRDQGKGGPPVDDSNIIDV